MHNNSRDFYMPSGSDCSLKSSLKINNCERYPRQRQTEFYRTPEPRPSLQSQKAEHASDRLNRPLGAEAPAHTQSPRIQPPRNSEIRIFRNSYFS